jgi:hypothetical protein
VALPCLVCVRTFPRALVHTTKEYFGLAIPNLYWEQGISHIDRLLRFGQSSHLTGRLIRQSLEALQVEIGSDRFPFVLDYSIYGILASSTWVSSTWEFVDRFNIGLQVQLPQLSLARDGDTFLMDLFVFKGYRRQQLVWLNRCRLFLKVARLSDIVTGCGCYLTRQSLLGIPDVTRAENVIWPTQGILPPSHWNLWKEAL